MQKAGCPAFAFVPELGRPFGNGLFMDCRHTHVRRPSHAICGNWGMRRTQQNSKIRLWSGRRPVGAILIAVSLCFAMSLIGQAIAGNGPDPILLGPDSWNGPCRKATSVDYAGGSDVFGNPVLPADVPQDRITVSMANENTIPEVLTHLPNLDRVRVNVAVHGLADEVQPDPACLQDTGQAPAKTAKPH